jgi:hypothetical protein
MNLSIHIFKVNKQENRDMSKDIKKYKEKREMELMRELKNAGLELRNDSVLCKNYINGTEKKSLKEIVKRMEEMKYLFEYCHMDECKKKAHQQQREELEAGYFPDIPVFCQAEMLALNTYSDGKYPKVFPWIKKRVKYCAFILFQYKMKYLYDKNILILLKSLII